MSDPKVIGIKEIRKLKNKQTAKEKMAELDRAIKMTKEVLQELLERKKLLEAVLKGE